MTRAGIRPGDRLLRYAAEAWTRHLREGDLLAHYGGEEFAIALPNCRGEQRLEVVERVRSATPQDGTCSAGLAELACDDDAHRLLRRADSALYVAKRDRDRVVLLQGA